MAEEINLATVKELIEGAKYLKSQLGTLNQHLEALTKERDELTKQVKNQGMQYASEKNNLTVQHLTEMETLRTKLQKEIEELGTTNKSELQQTVKSCDEKIQAVTDELTQKNTSLLKELQKTQESHQAVINRIRGLEA